MGCKHLKADTGDGYQCDLFKRRCPYQSYCNVTHRFKMKNEQRCPAYREAGKK